MAVITLLEGAKSQKNLHVRGVMELIAERSPITRYIPIDSISGNAYTYYREQSLPGFAWRGVNESYTRHVGTINPVTESVKILGGDIFIDNFILATQSDKFDIKAKQWAMQAKSISMGFSEFFFEGDSQTNPRVFDGLRTRLTGSQVKEAGANGAALTLDMLDELVDTIAGEGSGAHFFMNKTLRRKITKLGRNVAGSFPLLDVGDDEFGHKVNTYDGIPFHVIEREDNEATFLDFDETQGSSNVTASIYLVRFGDDWVKAIQAGGSTPKVYQVAKETEDAPGNLGRVDWYVGLAVCHPRSAARLKGITNA